MLPTVEASTTSDILRPDAKTLLESKVAQGELRKGDGSYLHYIQMLSSPETAYQQMPGLLEDLKKYSVTEETATNDRVREGYNLLRKFVTKIKPDLDQHNAAILTHGSMRFDDPHNLDFDLDILTENETPSLKKIERNWAFDLNKDWGKIGDEGHIAVFSVEELMRICNKLKSDDLSYINENQFWIELAAMDASNILIGNPLYSANPALVEKAQQEIMIQASETPLMASLMNIVLAGTLEDRQERRRTEK